MCPIGSRQREASGEQHWSASGVSGHEAKLVKLQLEMPKEKNDNFVDSCVFDTMFDETAPQTMLFC